MFDKVPVGDGGRPQWFLNSNCFPVYSCQCRHNIPLASGESSSKEKRSFSPPLLGPLADLAVVFTPHSTQPRHQCTTQMNFCSLIASPYLVASISLHIKIWQNKLLRGAFPDLLATSRLLSLCVLVLYF